jgi:tetratricopeptide (TPR) repeat protein
MNSEAAEVQSAKTVEFLAWFEVNKRRLLVGAVVLGVLAAGIAVQRWYQGERELAANTALLKAQLAESLNPGQSTPASEFQRVAAEHAGTAAAGRALLFAGEALFRDAQYGEALSEFENAAAKLKDESLAAVAGYGRAASLDALGRTAEAEAAYQEVAARYSSFSVAEQSKLALGGLLEQKGDLRQALQTYNQLTNAATSGWASEAQLRRAALIANHPELGATNSPAATVPVGT